MGGSNVGKFYNLGTMNFQLASVIKIIGVPYFRLALLTFYTEDL